MQITKTYIDEPEFQPYVIQLGIDSLEDQELLTQFCNFVRQCGQARQAFKFMAIDILEALDED